MRTLTWAAVIAVFLLMVIGNVVSATGSGLACPDWPLCHGRLIPPFQADVLIEYSHRLTAAVASVLLIATIIATIRSGSSRSVRRISLGLLVLLAAQIALGGITVLLRLPRLISTAHLVNALLILGGLLLLASRTGTRVVDPSVQKSARLARVGIAVLLVQLALGGYVRHAGAGLACPDFPLCSGDVLPSHWLGAVHWVHRWLGVALIGLFVHLAIASRRTPVATAATATAVLAVLQVTLGVAAVLSQLDPPVRALHAAVGYALWGTLIWTSARAGCWRRALSEPITPRRGTVEVARAS